MGFLHLFIVNKAGGLILHRPLGPNAPKIDTNEWLRIGSTFHSLHAIAAEASPVRLPGNKNSCEYYHVCIVVDLCGISYDLCFICNIISHTLISFAILYTNTSYYRFTF